MVRITEELLCHHDDGRSDVGHSARSLSDLTATLFAPSWWTGNRAPRQKIPGRPLSAMFNTIAATTCSHRRCPNRLRFPQSRRPAPELLARFPKPQPHAFATRPRRPIRPSPVDDDAREAFLCPHAGQQLLSQRTSAWHAGCHMLA